MYRNFPSRPLFRNQIPGQTTANYWVSSLAYPEYFEPGFSFLATIRREFYMALCYLVVCLIHHIPFKIVFVLIVKHSKWLISSNVIWSNFRRSNFSQSLLLTLSERPCLAVNIRFTSGICLGYQCYGNVLLYPQNVMLGHGQCLLKFASITYAVLGGRVTVSSH